MYMQVLKIQPQTFKSSYLKLIILQCSLVFSFFLHATTTLGLGIGVFLLVLYGIIGAAYLIIGIVYILIRNVKKDCKCLKVSWLVDIAYFIAGILYYVGINLLIPAATPILLGLVLVFYRFIPFFISKYYQSNLAKEHQTTEAKLQLVPEWILAAESLSLLVEFNALYGLIVFSFPRFNSCELAGSLVLWALFVLMYMFILFYTMNIQYSKCNINISCAASNLGAIVLIVAFGMHLLSSNFFPLGCFGLNARIAWIVMNILVLIVVITVIVLLLVYRCLSKTRQEKLLPRALYQHLHPQPDEQVNELPLESVNIDDEKKEII